MSNRLSYSQVRLYTECGQKYKYQYVDKLREKVRSGALCFGTAIDKALEAVHNSNLSPQEAFDKVFVPTFTHQEINDEMVHVPTTHLLVYSKHDLDVDLLFEQDIAELSKEYTADSLDDLLEIAENNPMIKNHLSWCCLKNKGLLMLKAHAEKVLPHITEVIGTQVAINLSNGTDSVIGFADLTCKWKGLPEPVVFDYKTSSIEYAWDSVITSPQLTLYAHSLGYKRAGYIVFNKRINKKKTKLCSTCGFDGSGTSFRSCNNLIDSKRCGGVWKTKIDFDVNVQILVDDVPERTEEVVIQNFDEVNKGINAGVFVRNFNACKGTFGLCPYYNKCFKNKEDNLIRTKTK